VGGEKEEGGVKEERREGGISQGRGGGSGTLCPWLEEGGASLASRRKNVQENNKGASGKGRDWCSLKENPSFRGKEWTIEKGKWGKGRSTRG